MGEADTSPTEEKHEDSGINPAEDSVTWSQEVEVCLFHAMLGHKPVGVNRHFHMICIRDKFCQNIGRQVSSKVIWDHLTTMYDMQALDESEILPFPNLEKSFVLPEEIIQDVKEGKLGQEEEEIEDAGEEGALCASAREGEAGNPGNQHACSLIGSTSSGNGTDSPPTKEEKVRERAPSESGSKETAEKRKRNRSTEKLLGLNTDPSSPGGAKRRRI
ncbi:MRG/MORF4L-binding protein-like isoform X1 [Anguilla rostrata]|uniref:MRG/MORF4L-binding protein-like isoform X1 n=1 Tax=Anguilla rostrata TaxID=7938 RepID=UPI0030D5AC5E